MILNRDRTVLLDLRIDMGIEHYTELICMISESFKTIEIDVVKEDYHSIYDEKFKSNNGLLIIAYEQVKHHEVLTLINKLNSIFEKDLTNRAGLKCNQPVNFVRYHIENDKMVITAIKNMDYIALKHNINLNDEIQFYDKKDLRNMDERSVGIKNGRVLSINNLTNTINVEVLSDKPIKCSERYEEVSFDIVHFEYYNYIFQKSYDLG